MNEFLASNEWCWRLARTIVQGVLGVVDLSYVRGAPAGFHGQIILKGVLYSVKEWYAENLDASLFTCGNVVS